MRYNILISPDGYVDMIEHADSIDFYHQQIGGMIEIVRVHDDIVMIVDDEGKLKNLPYNKVATYLYNTDDFIVGPALLDKRNGPELVGLTQDEAIDEMMRIIRVLPEDTIKDWV